MTNNKNMLRCVVGFLIWWSGSQALYPSGSNPRRRRSEAGGIGRAVALPIVGFFGVMCAPVYGKGLPGMGGMVNFATLTERTSPNEHLVAPLTSCPNFVGSPIDGVPRREEAPVYPVSVEELKTSFEAMLKRRYAIQAFARPTVADDRKRQYVYVERTPILRFPDVINVQFIPVDAKSSTLILHSGSVFGYSDLGKNRQRVSEMLRDIPNLPPRLARSSVQV